MNTPRDCRICGSQTDNPYFCHLCGAAAPACDAGLLSDARNRDLGAEAHLKALGLWFCIDAALFGLAAAAVVWSLWFGWARIDVNFGGRQAQDQFVAIALAVMVG